MFTQWYQLEICNKDLQLHYPDGQRAHPEPHSQPHFPVVLEASRGFLLEQNWIYQ